MQTLFDAYISFPATSDYSLDTIHRLQKLCESIENIEHYFGIEFSCGDGKFYNDYWNWTSDGSIVANYHSDEEYEEVAKYDGQVCMESLPRFSDTKILLEPNKEYNFTVLSREDHSQHEITFYINGRKRYTKYIEK
jgi:hypothetical protein